MAGMILGWHFQKITSSVPQVSAIDSFGPWMYNLEKYSFQVLVVLVFGKIGPLEYFGRITILVPEEFSIYTLSPWAYT